MWQEAAAINVLLKPASVSAERAVRLAGRVAGDCGRHAGAPRPARGYRPAGRRQAGAAGLHASL